MENFEARYPMEGSSALQPEAVRSHATIIEFPAATRQEHEACRPHPVTRPASDSLAAHAAERVRHSEVISGLRTGHTRGISFDVATRGQSIALGAGLFAFMLGVVLIAL